MGAIEKPGAKTSYAVLLITCFSMFVSTFLNSAVNISLPVIGREFKLDIMFLGWIPTIYLIVIAMLLVPAGRFGDIAGIKRVFKIGLIVFSAASFMFPFANSGALLIVFSIVQGAGSALIAATGVAILSTDYPPQERGRVLGFNTMAVYIGISAGPLLGGLLTEKLGWRAVYLADGFAGMLMVIASFIVFGKHEREQTTGKREIDIIGICLYSLGILALVTGFSFIPGVRGWLLTVAGLALLLLFGFYDARTTDPLLDIRLFLDRIFLFSNLAAFINYCSTFATTFLISFYLQTVRGYAPFAAGLLMTAQPVVMALVSPLAGKLSDSIQPRIIASFGMGLSALSLVLLSLLGLNTPPAYIIGAMVVLGAGLGFFASPNTNAVMSSVPRHRFGVAGAFLSTMRSTGQTFSMGVIMLVLSVRAGKTEQFSLTMTGTESTTFLGGMKLIFILFAVLCAVGIYLSLVRGSLLRTPLQKNGLSDANISDKHDGETK